MGFHLLSIKYIIPQNNGKVFEIKIAKLDMTSIFYTKPLKKFLHNKIINKKKTNYNTDLATTNYNNTPEASIHLHNRFF